MRMFVREKVSEMAMKMETARMLAASVRKGDIVQWTVGSGFVRSQLSDAVGISLQDLQAGKY
jgi:hypothetical protein